MGGINLLPKLAPLYSIAHLHPATHFPPTRRLNYEVLTIQFYLARYPGLPSFASRGVFKLDLLLIYESLPPASTATTLVLEGRLVCTHDEGGHEGGMLKPPPPSLPSSPTAAT